MIFGCWECGGKTEQVEAEEHQDYHFVVFQCGDCDLYFEIEYADYWSVLIRDVVHEEDVTYHYEARSRPHYDETVPRALVAEWRWR